MLGRCLVLSCGLAAGCNQIYDLDKTRIRDAGFFDAREDFECPAFGETPQFASSFTQIADCGQYSEAADIDRATAVCNGRVSIGPIDGPFVALAALGTRYGGPRFTPEGTELFVFEHQTALHVYHREVDDTFTFSRTITYPDPAIDLRFGTPSRGPNRRMLIGRWPESGFVDELEIMPTGPAATVLTHTAADLGVLSILGAPNMSADGLRIVFPARFEDSNHMMYADRQGLGDKFRPARILESIPYIFTNSPYINERCSRIYTVSDPVGSRTVWSQRL